MRINDNDYLNKEFDIEKSVLHVTLRATDDFAPKDVGSMEAEAEKAAFSPMIEHQSVWQSDDRRFIKIMIDACVVSDNLVP